MSNTTYYLAWLVAGLVASAIASGLIARHWRVRILRGARAVEVLDALGRLAAWVATQRPTMFCEADAKDGEAALLDLRLAQGSWFPQLDREATQLSQAHGRLLTFLGAQQLQRVSDPEAWLDADPDARFMELWAAHREAVLVLAARLASLPGVGDGAFTAGATPA